MNPQNRVLTALIASTLIAVFTWFVGWDMYTTFKIYETTINDKYQTILLAAIAIIYLAPLAFVYFTQPKTQPPEDPAVVYQEETEEYQAARHAEQKEKNRTLLSKEKPVKKTDEDIRAEQAQELIQQFTEEEFKQPQNLCIPTDVEFDPPKTPTQIVNGNIKDRLQNSKERIHNAIVDRLVFEIREGKIDVLPISKDILNDLGLKGLKVQLRKNGNHPNQTSTINIGAIEAQELEKALEED
jgi:hypothetical protein